MDTRSRNSEQHNVSLPKKSLPRTWRKVGMVSGGFMGCSAGAAYGTFGVLATWLIFEGYERGSSSKILNFMPIAATILLCGAGGAVAGGAVGGLSLYGLGLFRQKLFSPKNLTQACEKLNINSPKPLDSEYLNRPKSKITKSCYFCENNPWHFSQKVAIFVKNMRDPYEERH